MSRNVVGYVVLIGLLASGGASRAVAQGDSTHRPSIVTQGSADVTIPADQAVVYIAVIARERTAAKAAQANAVVARAMIDTLRAHGVPSDSVTTTGYRVDPENERASGRPNLDSYIARSQVRVVLRDLTKVGTVLDAALASGANELPQVTFQASSIDSARRVALANAVRNARADAQAAATAAGGRLGRILHLTIGNRNVYGGLAADMVALAPGRMQPSTPITPSAIAVNGQVSVEWEFVEGH